ncbi:MAG: hypothetical protein QXU18_13010 [Thermoplasmatales archaeon]
MTNQDEEKIDDLKVIDEEPVITLVGYDDYERWPRNHEYRIYVEQIKKAKIGASWWSPPVSNTRSSQEQEATLIYKNNTGAALLIETHSWADTPEGEEFIHRKLVWVSYGRTEEVDGK